jgi:hypothetical protein
MQKAKWGTGRGAEEGEGQEAGEEGGEEVRWTVTLTLTVEGVDEEEAEAAFREQVLIEAHGKGKL